MADEDESCGMFEEDDDLDAYLLCDECEVSDDVMLGNCDCGHCEIEEQALKLLHSW